MDSGGGVEDTRVAVNAGIQNNVWHHLVLTYNGSDNKLDLYVDGTKITTWTQFGGPLDSSNTSPFALGIARPNDASGKWGEFQGWLDDFRVYDTYLDASEVAGFINWVVSVQLHISSPLRYPVNTPRPLTYSSARDRDRSECSKRIHPL